MQYVTYALAALVLATLIGAFFYGRRSGKESQRVGDLQKTATIRDKQLDEANKPRDPATVITALKNGTFVLLLAFGLQACSADTSTCPRVVEYSPELQQKAGAELQKMADDGSYPTILTFLGDYKAERAQLRACFN